MAAKTFRDLRAWQAIRAYKLGIYALLEQPPLAADARLRDQLRESAASAQSHVTEGFGRFDPLDFARFVKMARASLLECQNHLTDAEDRRYITEDTRHQHDSRFEEALKEVGGLLDYLQSPEAKRNAERVRQQRIERRGKRRPRNPEP